MTDECVEIRRVGRWLYSLTLRNGMSVRHCGHRFGLKRARRLAERLLRRERSAPVVIVERAEVRR